MLRVFLALSLLTTASAAQAPLAPQLGPPTVWFGWYGAPRIAMVADVNADGLSDFVGLYPEGEGILDFVRTSALGKPYGGVQARTGFGAGALACVAADFDALPGAEVLALLPNGELRLACAYDPASHRFGEDRLFGSIPEALLPTAPCHAAALDAEGDGVRDVLVAGADGRLVLLRNLAPGEKMLACAVEGSLGAVHRLAAGSLSGKGPDEVVWLTEDGVVQRAALRLEGERWMLTGQQPIAKCGPREGFAVGRFRGQPEADVLAGQRLYACGRADAGVALVNAPDAATALGDCAWLSGDFNGDGVDDLLRHRRSGERYVGDDVLLEPCSTGTPPATILDSDGDGLRDAWETGAVKPGGLDLAALGCRPDHADVIVEVQPIEGVDADTLRSEMDRCVGFFAALPCPNPDGTTGIGLRLILREEIPQSREGEGWGALGEAFHPATHRGITHWMLIGRGGGGQSGEMADRGSCGIGACYATFLHEFGHQLGLSHTGGWQAAWCPTYPSMMNYAYSYQYAGDPARIRYSDGSLASAVLDERHLDEYLPLPIERLDFLAGPPYRYKLQPAEDQVGTLVDWNWNGVFGEKDITADINYGYSTYAGDRHPLGKTRTALALAEVPMAQGPSALVSFAGDSLVGEAPEGEPRPLRLTARVWQGEDPVATGGQWGPEVEIVPVGLTGDPSAICLGEVIWLAYPTETGIEVRTVRLTEKGEPLASPAVAVTGTAGAAPTLVRYQGAPWLVVWRGRETDLTILPLEGKEGDFRPGAERALGARSNWPVGAAEGEAGALWLGLAEKEPEGHDNRWEVVCFRRQADGSFGETAREWLGGPGAGHRGCERISLLWEPGPGGGSLHFYQCGEFRPEAPWACHYVGTRVKDQDLHHGWLVRRYYDEWSESRSGPGVCWFRGDIAYQMRWHAEPGSDADDRVQAMFFARGIDRAPMGDADDITLIRGYGLTHSIQTLAE